MAWQEEHAAGEAQLSQRLFRRQDRRLHQTDAFLLLRLRVTHQPPHPLSEPNPLPFQPPGQSGARAQIGSVPEKTARLNRL